MKGGTTSASRRPTDERRHALSGRRLAAVGVAGAVVGLMAAASAFQADPDIGVASVIPPATIERDSVPTSQTVPLVDVLGGSLTPEEALESCEQTLRALATVADVSPTPAGRDDRSVKERQQACSDVLDGIRDSLAASGALSADR